MQNKQESCLDLRKKSLVLAAEILEFSDQVTTGEGINLATEILESGKAWDKFKAICETHGVLKAFVLADHHYKVKADVDGTVLTINNRNLSQLAKLAGAPVQPSAGVEMHVVPGDAIQKGQTL